MKLSWALGLSIIATLTLTTAFADSTTTLTVEGMHCSGCKDMVKSKVCGNEEIAKNAASCDVKLVDEKKQIGEVTIVSKPETSVDVELVKKQVTSAGDKYRVSKVNHEVKDIKVSGTETTADQPVAGLETTTTTTATETVSTAKNGATKVIKKVKMKKSTKKADPAAEAAAANTAVTTETKTEVKKETK